VDFVKEGIPAETDDLELSGPGGEPIEKPDFELDVATPLDNVKRRNQRPPTRVIGLSTP
jgi:hypothetical protein